MRNIYLIARREFLSYVATWGFWISLASVPLFMAVGFGLPALLENSQPTRHYVLVDESGGDLERAIINGISAQSAALREEVLEQASELVAMSPQAQQMLESGIGNMFADDGYERVDPGATDLETLRPYLTGEASIETAEGPQPLFAAIYLRGNVNDGIEIEYWSANVTDDGLKELIKRALADHMRSTRLLEEGVSSQVLAAADALSPVVRELNPEREGGSAEVTLADRLPVIVGLAVGFVLWIIIFSVVNMLLTAMIEEKGNKVLEMMLASTRHHEILIGKLLGVAAVSATLLLFWTFLGTSGPLLISQFIPSADVPVNDITGALLDPALLLPALGYFIIGYLMYGAIFLAIGSLCETLQDAQTLMSPLMLVMMAPMLIMMMAADAPDSAVVSITSWVPVWTPFIMLARLPHDPPMIELVGTTVVMLVTAVLVIWGSGVLFRMGSLNQANQETIKGWFSFGKKR